MNVKPLALVVALLALAAGIVFWRNHRPVADSSADPRVGQPLVAVETLGQLRGLQLVAGGQSVTLAADKDGQRWTVPDYHDLPADFGKLVTLVESLRGAKVGRFVTAQPERLERLGFAGDRIELRAADAQPLLTLHLGKNADSGGRFVRFGDEKKAYLVDLAAWLDGVAKNWAQSQLLDLKSDAVAALDFRFADGSTFAATRTADGAAWSADGLPEGKELKGSTLDSLVTQLGALRFSETTETGAPDAVAAREHAQTVVVTLKDGTAYTVALGRRPAPPVKPETGDRKAETAVGPETSNSKPETISATTPPVTIGPDGKPQVVELPKEAQQPEPVAAPAAPPPQPGPVYAFIAANRETEPINALMQKRAFQVGEWILNSLPANREALLQDKPAPASTPAAVPAPAVDSAPAAPVPAE